MSIYVTIGEIWIPGEDVFEAESLDDLTEVYVQAVPGHIKDDGPIWEWLKPPVEDDDAIRAVFFCAPWTDKGTPRNGQEYTKYLLQLTGEEYATMPFPKVWNLLIEAIEFHMAEVSREGRRRARRTGR